MNKWIQCTDGRWINLDHVQSFVINEGNDETFEIRAYWTNHYYIPIKTTYKTREIAQKSLDDLIERIT